MSLSITHKVASVTIAVLVMLGLVLAIAPSSAQAALTEAQVQSILSLLTSFGADASVVANVEASLRGTTPSPAPVASNACPYTWTRNLQQGATGADVQKLQQFLNSMSDTTIAASGAGSVGNETTFFGPATKAAVVKFQNKYSADVLAPVGLTAGTGFFGASSRAKANSLCTSATPTPTPTPGTPTPTPATGTNLTVAAAAQPANSIAPINATRIPYTRFTVTAGTDGDVVMNSVTVERTGLAADADFLAVLLLDQDGNQVGTTKTLNSNHQATPGEAVTIPKGTTRTFTVAANRAAAGGAGNVGSFTIRAINTSATVLGSLPIVGATHTNNSTLTIGSVTTARGSNDPGANQTKEVGTLAYTFSSVKVTAGSAEKVFLKSIRWNQTGSASDSGDLNNVVTVVDGVSYATAVSADGNFYTSTFPGSGLLIDKGFSKDISIQGDIVSGSNRTVDFDIAKRTDINIVGETFGFGINPPLAGSAAAADGAAFNNADDPYYDAAQVTISTGTMTVSVWTGVAAQNISENENNQTLGGFTADVKGEAISVAQIVFRLYHVGASANVTFADVDSVSLVDQNGSVIAGPVDATDGGVDAVNGLVTFTDTVTFPVGVTNLTLKGKLGSDFDTNDTIAASTTPSTDWTTVTGQVTGNTITPSPTSALTSPTMTVKSGSLTVSVSSVPIAQTVIAGASQFEFARYILDATGSGEDLRVTTIPLYYDTSGTRTDLTNCKLFDGSTVLTTGGNVKNPATGDTASSTTMTFDGSGLIVSKGTSKTVSLKCDVRSGATGIYWWGIDAGQNAAFTGVTGVASGQTIAETFTDSSGQRMTAATGGSLTPVLDTNSPSYRIVSSGTTGVELSRIKFSATNEDVDLRQVALQLTSVASNTPVDLVNREVKLYDEAGTLIATAVFPTGDNATSSAIASGAFRILRDGSKVMVVKGDIAAISNSGPLTASGDNLIVDYDGDNEGTNGNYGVGVSSGSNVTPAASDTASQGVRLMRGYPVFAAQSLPSTQLVAGGNKALYRFKVTAVDSDVAVFKLTFDVGSSTESATTSTYGLYAYTDSAFSSADTTFSNTGLLNASNFINGLGVNADASGDAQRPSIVEVYMDKASATTTYIVPKGGTRYFELQATVSSINGANNTAAESISISLLGDAAFPVNSSTLMSVAGGASPAVDGDTNDDFIWSPVSTTTQNTVNDLDFTNGYQVQGVPGTNMPSVTLTSST